MYEVTRLCEKIKERCQERAEILQGTAVFYVSGLRFPVAFLQ
ncbi:hypothetical protein BACEGG_00532 [Bacteroides eggerthii DSM 20697]|nr:hypothetical protein BACEGG_00532 [Bacteroides eggerthii DSM 20697]